MDKKLFIIAIAVGSAVLTTLLSVYLQRNEPSPKAKRLLRILLAAGLAMLIVMCAMLLNR
jgi:uncharacterized membrane protein